MNLFHHVWRVQIPIFDLRSCLGFKVLFSVCERTLPVQSKTGHERPKVFFQVFEFYDFINAYSVVNCICVPVIVVLRDDAPQRLT